MNYESLIPAILLGIVEGLTEFIPVSSTGHLILFGEAISFKSAAGDSFEIFIQLGAILAVLVLYPNRFKGFFNFSAPYSQYSFLGLSGLVKLGLACLPAFILGFLFHDKIKTLLFFPAPVAIALIIGGLLLILIDKKNKSITTAEIENITYKQCLLIGIFQTLALWPGFSRSGATIIGGLLVGLNRTIAAEFSFLVAVPVMFAATFYDLYKSYSTFSQDAAIELAVGFIVSFLVAIVAIKTFIKFLQNSSLAPFGYYRIVLGLLVLYYLS